MATLGAGVSAPARTEPRDWGLGSSDGRPLQGTHFEARKMGTSGGLKDDGGYIVAGARKRARWPPPTEGPPPAPRSRARCDGH